MDYCYCLVHTPSQREVVGGREMDYCYCLVHTPSQGSGGGGGREMDYCYCLVHTPSQGSGGGERDGLLLLPGTHTLSGKWWGYQ